MDEPNQPGEQKQWNASCYEDGYAFVWKHGGEVVDLLAPRPGERILDLACGTGHLTAEIARRGARVIGIDRSSEMIATANRNYPWLTFKVADAETFHFDEPFDAVFSNAALHWMKNQRAVADCVRQSLRPGGRFVAEFGGKDNIRAIEGALVAAIKRAGYSVSDEPYYYFPSIGEHATLLERAGFTVTYAMWFERPTKLEGGEAGMRNWLEFFVDHYISHIPADGHAEVIAAVEDELRPELFRDGAWYADYCRLRMAAMRNP